MKRPYSPWTNREIETLQRMARDRHTNREISQELGRSHCAVAVRACMYRPQRQVTPVLPSTTLTISKADLPEYYAIGWRVDWFKGDVVGLKWVNSPLREPYVPTNQCMRAA